MAATDASTAIEFCVQFFTQIAATGTSQVVLSPGSRSTPLTLGAHAAGLDLSVQIDERSGGFFALGLAKATRSPVALVCTSGTAAANYLPAVVEAAHSGVPLLVLTADRPPELRSWGAGQTIDQAGMFGSNVRWRFEAPVASEAPLAMAAGLAARAVLEATRRPAGPIHVNFPFREPLVDAGGVPGIDAPQQPILVPAAVDQPALAEVEAVADLVRTIGRGVVVAGPADHDPAEVAAINSLARSAGWPILAEPTSQLRTGPHVDDGTVVATADVLLRSRDIADELAPDAVFAVGGPPTSKPLRRWLERTRPGHVVVTDVARDLPDPSNLATLITRSSGAAVAGRVAETVGDGDRPSEWAGRWAEVDTAAAAALGQVLEREPITEPAAIRVVADAVPTEAAIYLANSMPVRDADAVWPATPVPRRFFSQRGAAGIDGLTSGATGAARGLGETVVLITGDLAFLHDFGGIMAAGREEASLVVVVLDNGGGSIFSMLPVAENVSADVFHRLYTTPHAMDIAALAAAAGVECHRPASLDQLRNATAEACATRRPSVIHLALDPAAGWERRRQMAEAVHLSASAVLYE